MSALNFTQKIAVIISVLGTFYIGILMYKEYRLTIEHKDSIKKWCVTDHHYRFFKGEDTWEQIDSCTKLRFKN